MPLTVIQKASIFLFSITLSGTQHNKPVPNTRYKLSSSASDRDKEHTDFLQLRFELIILQNFKFASAILFLFNMKSMTDNLKF